jgi:hypothetical protein
VDTDGMNIPDRLSRSEVTELLNGNGKCNRKVGATVRIVVMRSDTAPQPIRPGYGEHQIHSFKNDTVQKVPIFQIL